VNYDDMIEAIQDFRFGTDYVSPVDHDLAALVRSMDWEESLEGLRYIARNIELAGLPRERELLQRLGLR